MVTFENNVGRLVELRLAHPVQPAEAEPMARFLISMGEKKKGEHVLVVDARGGVMPQEFVVRLIETLRVGTPARRTAVLLAGSATLRMQAERILKSAGEQATRHFQDTAPALEWLAEVLSLAELERARTFFAGGARAPTR